MIKMSIIKTIEEAKVYIDEFLKNNKDVHSPYFKERIAINAKLKRHIFYKARNRVRPEDDTIRRVRILPYAIELIKGSHFYNDYNIDNRSSNMLKYWSFEATVENIKIKVVVKQQNNGDKFLWSLMTVRKKELYREN